MSDSRELSGKTGQLLNQITTHAQQSANQIRRLTDDIHRLTHALHTIETILDTWDEAAAHNRRILTEGKPIGHLRSTPSSGDIRRAIHHALTHKAPTA